MRDNNFQIGGSHNNQKINNKNPDNWQDNIILYSVIGVIIAVIAAGIAKLFGYI